MFRRSFRYKLFEPAEDSWLRVVRHAASNGGLLEFAHPAIYHTREPLCIGDTFTFFEKKYKIIGKHHQDFSQRTRWFSSFRLLWQSPNPLKLEVKEISKEQTLSEVA